MKIGFVCPEYPPGPHGGIGTFVQMMGRALTRAGHEVRVVGVYDKTYSAADYEEDRGVKVWRLRSPNYRLGWMAARISLFRTVAAWCRKHELDIIEVPDYQGWAAFWPALPIPVVTRLHGSATYFAAEMGQSVRRSVRWLEEKSLRRSSFWCSVSRYTAEKTKALFDLKTGPHAVLHNPVELPPVSHEPRSKTDIVFTGTLTEKKGIIPLIASWPDTLRQCNLAKLHIYGKDGRHANGGSMREYLESLLNEHERQSVIFHGHQPREVIFQALREARAAIFPSRAEAFAIAPLEAMACGCPTIYSQLGSGPELIQTGENGWLVDPSDTDSLTNIMVRVLTDHFLVERLGPAGRKHIEQFFSLDHIIPQNESFYQECVERYGT